MDLDNIIKNFKYIYHNSYLNFILRKKRNISSPLKELKEYQYIIKEYLENKYFFPFFITWYRKWLSVYDNASIHRWKKYIINLDIKDFFWNITRKALYNQFKSEIINIDLFLDYITYKWVLPQWAPTSPILSNIIFTKIDFIIREKLLNISNLITYSRYVDDISIWFDDYENKHEIFTIVKDILNKNWFLLNDKKTKIYHYNKKLLVTWLIINNDNVWIWYKKYRRSRKLIYIYLKYNQWYFPYIKWMLLYIKWVDYKRYEQLKNIFFNDFGNSNNYKELFFIYSNWIKVIKSGRNKFNKHFNYNRKIVNNYYYETFFSININEKLNKNSRFSKWKELLEEEYEEEYWYDTWCIRKYNETDDDRWLARL